MTSLYRDLYPYRGGGVGKVPKLLKNEEPSVAVGEMAKEAIGDRAKQSYKGQQTVNNNNSRNKRQHNSGGGNKQFDHDTNGKNERDSGMYLQQYCYSN